MTSPVSEREPPSSAPQSRHVRPSTRVVLASVAAAVSLVAALIAAIGPARGESSEYFWPPTDLPAERPTHGWYAPLPLLNRVPARLELSLPCDLAPALGAETRVLSTARRPREANALWVDRAPDALRIGVGASELAAVPWPGSCPLRLEVAEGELRLPDRTIPFLTGALDDMPIVTGLFTTLDLRSGAALEVVVRTRVYATSQTARQAAAALVALGLLVVGLFLLVARQPSRRVALGSRLRALWHAREPVDAVVVATLLVWWILAPSIFDDGWVWIQHRSFDDLGTNVLFYDTWSITSPVGFWFEWLRHRASGSTSQLVFMRLPSLAVLLLSWPLCRWCLSRTVPGGAAPVLRWTLAGAFLVGATAWGMTLRPEPFASFFVLVALAAMTSFVADPRPAPLTVALPATALAVTAHPVGLLAAAPVIAALPEGIRWVRDRGPSSALALLTLVLGACALFVVLATLDADLTTRIADARVASAGDFHGEPWWREYVRYDEFDARGGETAGRRLSLALLVLVVLAWLTRRRRTDTEFLTLPSRAVAGSLLLLALISSKWPWHFGALAALGSVAVAVETGRLLRELADRRARPIRPVAALLVFGAATLWAWRAGGEWSQLDLQRLTWDDGFHGLKGYASLVVLLVAGTIAARAWSRPNERPHATFRARDVGWAVPFMPFAFVALTMAMLLVDATITPWSPARQNLDALVARGSCGLAHQLRGVPDPVFTLSDPDTRSLALPPVGVYFPCATPPRVRRGVIEIPDRVVFQGSPWALEERDGPFAALPELYAVERAGRGPRGVELLSVNRTVPGFTALEPSVVGG